MAQDPPRPAESDNPESRSEKFQPGAKPANSAPQLPPSLVFQGVATRLLPVLRNSLLQVLRSVAQFLEQAIAQLEAAEPPAGIDPPGQSPSPVQVPRWGQLLQQLQALGSRLQTLGVRVRPAIRDRLPATVNRRLSDPALAGAIAGLLILVLWSFSTLLPDQAPEPGSPVISQPIASPAPPSRAETDLPAPAEPQPVQGFSSPAPTPEPSASPTLALNPEQGLIAAIQTHVAAITDRYTKNLIQSVAANFQGSQLGLQVSEAWYSLPASEQEQLAAEMLQRSRDLDFNTLTIMDNQGRQVARSPVVGSKMVILKRHLSSAVPF